ncbi:MAG: AsnC family transcriptional regulator [Rhizomicrobium sp.]
MEHHKLDSIDLRILAELQANGRITNVELSRRQRLRRRHVCAACARWRRPASSRATTPISTPRRSASR